MNRARFKLPAVFWILLPLLLGVVIQFHFEINFNLYSISVFAIALLVLGFPVISKLKWTSAIFFLTSQLVFFGIGGFLGFSGDSTNHDQYFWSEKDSTKAEFIAILKDAPEEKENSIKLHLEVLKKNGKRACGDALLYLEKDSSKVLPKYGDLIAFETSFNDIKPNNNPLEFDYSRYLKIHNIHNQSYVKIDEWEVGEFKGSRFMSQILEWRTGFSEILAETEMDQKNIMVSRALLLGQKEFLDKDVLRSYSSAGAMHILAVSGLHVGIVMLIFTFFFKPLKKLKKGKTLFLVLVLGVIWFYALITGLSPSVTRAAVMFSFILIGQELQRETSVYQSIMVSAIILILIEPYIIFQVGFQLSYLAVLGIVYLQPKIYNLWFIKNKILDKAWQISAVSIAAQLATFPLGLYYFHQFPNFFMLSNLIVIPLAFVLLVTGIAYLALHWVPVLSDLVLFAFDFLLSALNAGVEWIEKLPYSILWGISISWYEVFLIYLLIVGFSISFIKKSGQLLLASVFLLLIFLALNLSEKVKISFENKVFIYNVRNELAFDVFYGSENRFYSSQAFYEDEPSMLFHVKHNWFHRSGKEEPTEWVENVGIELISVGEYEIGFLSSQPFSYDITDVDYVVIHDVEYLDESQIESLSGSRVQLVLGPGIGYGIRELLQERIDRNKVFDLSEDGCFELDF